MSTIESDLPVVVQEHSNSATPQKFQDGAYNLASSTRKGSDIDMAPYIISQIGESASNRGGESPSNQDSLIGRYDKGDDDGIWFGKPPTGFGEPWHRPFKPSDKNPFLPDLTITEPSKEQRDDAEKQFDKDVSCLLSDADQKTLKSIGHAILEGDPKALASALAGINNPERLKQFVKETNHMLKELGSSAELAIGPNGNVLEYSKNGNFAIEIDPKKGEVVGERPIEVTHGTVVLKDGTVLNGDVNEDAKKIGKGAVGEIENPFFKVLTGLTNMPHFPSSPIEEQPWFKAFEQGSRNRYFDAKSNITLL